MVNDVSNSNKGNKIVDYLILFLLAIPPILERWEPTHQLYLIFNFLKILFGIVVLFHSINYKKDSFCWAYILFIISTLISTVINHGDIRAYGQFVVSTLIVVFWTQYYITDMEKLKHIYIYFSVLSACDFLSMLLWPEGILYDDLYRLPIWLLGTSNYAVPFLICSASISLLFLIEFKRKSAIIGFITSTVAIYMGTAATGKMAISVIVLFCVFIMIYRGKFVKIPSSLMLIGYMFIFFIICIAQNFHQFDFLVEGILNKDMTMSGRTEIWIMAIDRIFSKPVLGYGIQPMEQMEVLVGHSHCHDFYLNTGVQSGILGLSFWLASLFIGFKRLGSIPSNIASIIRISIFALMVTFLTESYNYRYMGPLFILLSFANKSSEIVEFKDI